LLLLCCFAFTACDSNKSKIEEKAKQFTEALKTKDVATIYDMYPNSKLAYHMTLTTNVAPGDLEVVKDEATGNFKWLPRMAMPELRTIWAIAI